MSGSQFQLYFVNGSTSAGTLCVYQADRNVSVNQTGLTVLAWMMAGANPSTVIEFIWTTTYDFMWIDYDQPRSYGRAAANLNTANSITFAKNSFGYYFPAPPTGVAGSGFTIQSDGTIPSVNNTVAGIGMSGAGTFAAPAKPNLNYVFTPVADASLTYCVSFGYYTFQVGDPVPVSQLNPSGQVRFPPGVSAMTATLNSANQWNIYAGAPLGQDAALAARRTAIVYEAGKGILLGRIP